MTTRSHASLSASIPPIEVRNPSARSPSRPARGPRNSARGRPARPRRRAAARPGRGGFFGPPERGGAGTPAVDHPTSRSASPAARCRCAGRPASRRCLRGRLGRVSSPASGDASSRLLRALELRTASGEARVRTVTGSAPCVGLRRLCSSGPSVTGWRPGPPRATSPSAGPGDVTATPRAASAIDRVGGGPCEVKTSRAMCGRRHPGPRVWLDLSSMSGRHRVPAREDGAPDGAAQVP